ncbi:MAG TPA: glycosyltransferase family 2 protein [Gaiellaceae bacterium]|nr:glycosyltransferase family 2 protein [Gaiellaceae bacterium]
MKLVMTLLARNEADIVDAQIAFHLHAGVDFVIATDNRSDDETTEILERYERAGYLHLLREDGDDMRQSEWVTRMARMAATDFGADWVINSDADEFWWPRGGTLEDVLALVPPRFGVVRGCWRHFLPRPGDDTFFAERMTVRFCVPAPPGDKRTVFHAHQKVAHRANTEVVIEAGNHNAIGEQLEPFRSWHPIEVLHFSIRSVDQVARKAGGGWVRSTAEELVEHQARLDAALHTRRFDEFFDAHCVSDEQVGRGLADGTLALDTRLRDALRELREPTGSFRLPHEGSMLAFAEPDLVDAAAYAAEASVLVGFDGIVRAEQRVAAIEERLAALRTLPRR